MLDFVKKSAGGQRFLERPEIVDDYAQWFRYRITIGGTCPRSAIAMAKMGYRSRLHLVTNNEHIRRLLPVEAAGVFSGEGDSLYPHLIVQYARGIRIDAGDIHIVTDRANRIIYDNDPDNSLLKLNPAFFDDAESIRVLLISGFNTMLNRDLLTSRLRQLSVLLDKLPGTARIFYEDAGFYDNCFPGIVQDALRRYIHVYSLNEDELMNYAGERIDLLNPSLVYGAVRRVMKKIRTPVMVVHTKYWALACGEEAERYRPSLKGGIVMATARFRFGDAVSEEKYRLTATLAADPQGASFRDGIEALGNGRICCEPSLAAPETRVTAVGLGDAFVGGFIPALIE
jgi:ADP-dependent phosphofructokinase/glucokinase